MLRQGLTILIFVVLFVSGLLLLTTFASGEEIRPNISSMNVTESFNSVADVPYEYALQMHPDLYFMWALKKNAEAYGELPPTAEPVIKTTRVNNGRGVVDPTGVTYQGRGRIITFGERSTDTVRTYQPVRPGLPVMIYNPYFRPNPR